jgi:hypothetical protein
VTVPEIVIGDVTLMTVVERGGAGIRVVSTRVVVVVITSCPTDGPNTLFGLPEHCSAR